MNVTIDRNLGINQVAYTIIDRLAEYSFNLPDGYYTLRSAAFYNGREKGIVLYLTPVNNKQVNIAFYEHRSSDNIVVDSWESAFTFGPPDINCFSEVPGNYKNRQYFEYDNYDEAVSYILEILEKYKILAEKILKFR